jgi:hypothetical protein
MFFSDDGRRREKRLVEPHALSLCVLRSFPSAARARDQT